MIKYIEYNYHLICRADDSIHLKNQIMLDGEIAIRCSFTWITIAI